MTGNSQTTGLTKQSETSLTNDTAKALSLCKMADTSFNLTNEQLNWIGSEIEKDFSDISTERIKEIIVGGIKGEYSDVGKNYPINTRTIYDWIKVALGRNVAGMNYKGQTILPKSQMIGRL